MGVTILRFPYYLPHVQAGASPRNQNRGGHTSDMHLKACAPNKATRRQATLGTGLSLGKSTYRIGRIDLLRPKLKKYLVVWLLKGGTEACLHKAYEKR